VAWTIEAALAASLVNWVVVSTDDEEIAEVANRFGAEVVMRPAEISGDLSSSEAALVHALEVLETKDGYRPDVLAFLQCTAPLTLPEDIDGTVRLVLEGGFDSAVTMIPFHYFIWRQTAGFHMEGVNHVATHRLMRQEREPEFMEVGAVYAMHVEGFLEQRHRFFGRIGKYLLPPYRGLEVDEPEDWILAETLMQSTGRTQVQAPLPSLDQVQVVVTDFDGVMTDNRVHLDQRGIESVTCNRGDGWGIGLLREAGILVACISTERNPVVRARCQKLGIPYWQGQDDKLSALRDFLEQNRIPSENCLYIGNDTNDAACLEYAGVAVVPRDVAQEVTHLADWRTQAAGGEGVLREVAREILKVKAVRS
jgi:YrbI family 3-deoxy-D-manno-octulosonate 8-phosphate phosphatase